MVCRGCNRMRVVVPTLWRQAKRWLATNDPRWIRIRARQLAREPLCRHCKAKGVTTPATVADHIDGTAAAPNDYRDDNLQSLCETCHGVKTALENGSFGRPAGQAKRAGFDESGIPLDESHPWRKQT